MPKHLTGSFVQHISVVHVCSSVCPNIIPCVFDKFKLNPAKIPNSLIRQSAFLTDTLFF